MSVKIYSDLGNRENPLVFAEEAISHAVRNTIQTPKRSVWGKPEYGSDTIQVVFDPVDEITERELFLIILEDVRRFDPRITIKVHESSIEMLPDQNTMVINLVIAIYGDINVFNLSIPVAYE